RDNLLSTTVALADGRVIQAGRVVVKNVAGYDLPKLFIGSQGTLGLMADVTLKLYPLPRARQSLALPVATVDAGLAAARAIAGELRVNTGTVITPGTAVQPNIDTPFALVITAEGIREDVENEMSTVRAILAKHFTMPIELERSATELWQQQLGTVAENALLVRVGLPPQVLPTFLTNGKSPYEPDHLQLIDVVNGLLYLSHTPSDPDEGHKWLTALRRAAEAQEGYAVVMTLPSALHGTTDRWGHRPAIAKLMHQLRAQWDPQGILAGE
ncbi:MAG: FAD-binding oxidoreductase, partial [Caldilineaceae bacterium]|nr:FAD-binding oxidoreductase [Caldilineaceae bacterium]